MPYESYDTWHSNLITHLYGGCDCHDSAEHDLDMHCRCEVCYSNAIDILSDRECDRQMERAWDKPRNQ